MTETPGLYRQQTEKQFMATVLKLARLYGWRTYHTFDSRRSAAGFPDVVAIHPVQERLLVAELKSEAGKLSPEQAMWLDDFLACQVEAYVWRPSDLETVRRILAGEGQQ